MQVIPYWYKWMKAFPTVFALEQASVEQVHALWAGLGYYSRARRLLEGAKEIVKTFDGVIPDSVDLLKRIPGIGPYTAGAIASIAYNKQEPLVDGNVIRVFSRLRAIEVEPGPVLDKICWSIAADIIDPEHPSAFNQGLMELGATVCKPTNPLCDRCPLSKICDARGLLGTSFKRRDADMEELFTDVTYFPLKKPKKEPTKVQLSVCVFSWKHPETFEIKYLFLRRPATGLLALQWEFPSIQLAGVECDDEVSALPVCTSEQLWTAFPLYIKESVGLECVVVNDGTGGGSNVDKLVCSVGDEVLEPIVHIFSHQIHNMHVFICDVKDIIPSFAEHGEGMKEGWRESRWMSAKEIVAAGITSGCKKVLAAVSSSTESKNSKKRKPHPGNGGTENKESSRSMEKWLKKLG
jgi:A/G-specific adenine glycosylase